MKLFFTLLFTGSLFLTGSPAWSQLPSQPTEASHPGSAHYGFSVQQENFQLSRRRVDVYLPAEAKSRGLKVPVVVFGHGQAIDVTGYDATFKHLAAKGVAVIHPTYDSGFMDQDWRRMADDFNTLTEQTLNKYADVMDQNKIIYAGHSKGAYIALMAAGAASLRFKPGALVLFAPAGYDTEYLNQLNTQMPVSIFWSDGDTVIKQSLINEIYTKAPSKFKQFILVKSYSSLKADHFFPLSKSYFFGGQNGTTAFHYHGFWKWLMGAALDLNNPESLTNTYLYGPEAVSTGVTGHHHRVTRSW